MRIQLYNPEQINTFQVRFDPVDQGLNSRYLLPEFAFLADRGLTGILTAVGGDALLKEVYNKDLAPEGWFELIHPLDIMSILSLTVAYQLNAGQVRELCHEIIHFEVASKNCEAILVRSQVMKRVIEASKALPPRPASGNTKDIEAKIQTGLRSVLSNNDRLVKARKMTQQQARLIMGSYNNPQVRLNPEAVGGAKNSLIERSSAFGGFSYVELYEQYLEIKNPKPLPIAEPRVDLRPAEAIDSYNHLLTLYLRASPNNLNEIRSTLGNRAVQILGTDMRPVQHSFLSPEALERGKTVSERRGRLDSGFLLAQWLGAYEMSRMLIGNVSEADYFSRMKDELDREIKEIQRPHNPNPNPQPVMPPAGFPDQFIENDLPIEDDFDDPNFDWESFLGAHTEPNPIIAPERSKSPVIQSQGIQGVGESNVLTKQTYQSFIDELSKGKDTLERFKGTLASLRSMYANSIDVPQVIKVLSKSQLMDLFSISSSPDLSVGFVRENFTTFTRTEMPDPQRFVNKTQALFIQWSGNNQLPAAIKAQLQNSDDFHDLSDQEIVETFQNAFKWLDADTMRCIPNAIPNKAHTTYTALGFLIPIAAVQSAFEEDD